MKTISKAKWCLPAALAAFACFGLHCASSWAVAPGKATASPARILLEKSSKALGENRPWTTRVEKGLHIAWNTEGWGTLKADYTRSVKKPDKLKIDQDNSAYDHPFFRMYYYNGGDAWYMTNLIPGRNPQVTANMKALVERVDGIAYYLAACDTFFGVAQVPGDSLLPGQGLARAGCVLRGDTTLFDVDAKTHILARRIENKGARFYILEDYRDVKGHAVPFHITVYDGGKKTNEFLWREITFDERLDDAMFDENRPPKQ
jgi:hypothetical protein